MVIIFGAAATVPIYGAILAVIENNPNGFSINMVSAVAIIGLTYYFLIS